MNIDGGISNMNLDLSDSSFDAILPDDCRNVNYIMGNNSSRRDVVTLSPALSNSSKKSKSLTRASFRTNDCLRVDSAFGVIEKYSKISQEH